MNQFNYCQYLKWLFLAVEKVESKSTSKDTNYNTIFTHLTSLQLNIKKTCIRTFVFTLSIVPSQLFEILHSNKFKKKLNCKKKF